MKCLHHLLQILAVRLQPIKAEDKSVSAPRPRLLAVSKLEHQEPQAGTTQLIAFLIDREMLMPQNLVLLDQHYHGAIAEAIAKHSFDGVLDDTLSIKVSRRTEVLLVGTGTLRMQNDMQFCSAFGQVLQEVMSRGTTHLVLDLSNRRIDNWKLVAKIFRCRVRNELKLLSHVPALTKVSLVCGSGALRKARAGLADSRQVCQICTFPDEE